jgi:Cof subfamily protein (haloacid dehalogenase superfamily)
VLDSHLESRLSAPRVVAADLDGTLLPLVLDGTQTVTPSTIQVVRALERIGIMTILVTGRMFRSAARYARDLGLEGPVAAYQGALIREVGTGRLLHHDPLSVELALEVLDFVEPLGYPVNLYIDDDLYVAQRSAEVDRYERLSGMRANVVGRLSGFLDRPTTKMGVGGDPAAIDELLTTLRPHFAGRLIVVKTWPFFLELTSPTATKARALQILGERMGFTAGEVMAFGDSYNDTDMLAWAGTGVAMRGAPPEVVDAADFVCDPVEDDGFARYLTSLSWFPAEEFR